MFAGILGQQRICLASENCSNRNVGMNVWVCFVLLLINCLCVAAPAPKKTRGELYRDVDADYYGYRDEDDGVLLPLEQQEEQKGEQVVNYSRYRYRHDYLDF